MEFLRKLKKIGSDDPRRIIHCLKVGLGLTLVSTFYYVNPLFDGFGQPVMWAVLTVVLVMEFTVGAAVIKGLNRTCATFLAGALGIGAHHLASLLGEKGEPIVLGVAVFLVASTATFARFVPELKAKYDYGVVIFILTFCLVTVSSYRKENVFLLAKERLITIAIGVLISFLISIFVFPVWAGDDLHRLATANLEKLASTMQVVGEALKGNEHSFIDAPHKGVLNSISAEDSLASMVKWEPPHGRFGFRHPWGQYRKIGDESRRCAYLMEALNIYLASSYKVESGDKMLVEFAEMSFETCRVLREVGSAVRSMSIPSATIKQCISVDQMKNSLLENCVDAEEMLRIAPVVSLLIEIFGCTGAIVASVEELAKLAHFKSSEAATSMVIVKKSTELQGFDHVVIEVEE